MIFNRDNYLEKIISKINDNRIKIVTGLRRSGKSTLLNELFYNYLIKSGIFQDHIIRIEFDDYKNKNLLNSDNLYNFVLNNIKDNLIYYLILDEIQLVDNFTSVLLGFYHISNLNVFVSGSNAKFLSKDILTEFNDRGVEIKIYPLSFKEFYKNSHQKLEDAYKDYITYGGLPKLIEFNNENDKKEYLISVYKETYLKDLIIKNNIRNKIDFNELVLVLSSSIGSRFSALKISNTFKSLKNKKISTYLIEKYIDTLEDSFLIEKIIRKDLKGKKFINSNKKYYFKDLGIRNAILNFNQLEETHLLENLIYNELIIQGYEVNLGSIIINQKDKNQKSFRKELEIDFEAKKNNKTYYIQVSLDATNKDKLEQELRPFKYLDNGAKKILIVKQGYLTSYNEDNYLILNLFDFLLKDNPLDL